MSTLSFKCGCGQTLHGAIEKCYYCGHVFGNFAASATRAVREVQVEVKRNAGNDYTEQDFSRMLLLIQEVLRDFGCRLDSFKLKPPDPPAASYELPTTGSGPVILPTISPTVLHGRVRW